MDEKKKKVFISGPMSGIKDFNKPAFDQAEQWLTHAGYSVFNPARMHFDDAWSHEEIMRIDLAALSQCDYILMLAGFEASIGAMQEYRYAMATGIEMLRMSDIECPKKEEKPSQRIEIKTFGDISEENINMLMLVERHYSELLATGGTITKVKITCEPKPTSDAPKTCGTCKYNADSNIKPLRPCIDCGPFKNWEPKPTSDVPKKSCKTCKYVKYKMLEEPCASCTMPFTDSNHAKWEPKEE